MKLPKYTPVIVSLFILTYVALQERWIVEEKFSPCSIHISVNYVVSKRKYTKNSVDSLQSVSASNLPIQFYVLNDDSTIVDEFTRSSRMQYTFIDRAFPDNNLQSVRSYLVALSSVDNHQTYSIPLGDEKCVHPQGSLFLQDGLVYAKNFWSHMVAAIKHLEDSKVNQYVLALHHSDKKIAEKELSSNLKVIYDSPSRLESVAEKMKLFAETYQHKTENPEKNIHPLYFQFSRKFNIPIYVIRHPLVEDIELLDQPNSFFVEDY